MSVAAVIVAAGRGSRADAAVPKQFRPVAGRSVLARALEAFLSHPRIDRVQPVIDASHDALYRKILAELVPADTGKLLPAASGGPSRQASARLGLEALAAAEPSASLVLIHDAARPFASAALIDRAITAGASHGAAVPAIAVSDTIKIVDPEGRVMDTPPRAALRAIQTPQAFTLAPLLKAHRAAAAAGLDHFTDDGALAEWAGLPVSVFPGEAANLKLTHAADFDAAEERAGSLMTAYCTRVGAGFDVHAFGPGDHVWLAGVRIAHERGVLAHSDGDVVLHALTDALLGALGEGDIGMHFPPSDPQWRGASSDRFLAFAAERVRAGGGVIDHVDVTILCEAPRIGAHREAMRARIAAIAGLAPGSVSVKATTTEGLGFAGRREGLAAQAIATVRMPAADRGDR